jgi:hypothetical protein
MTHERSQVAKAPLLAPKHLTHNDRNGGWWRVNDMSATAASFRRLALSLPEASEASHMGQPDFRVRNKIFASLGTPDKGWGTVKVSPEQQEILLAAEPAAFKPAAGAWGRRGWTHVRLAAVDLATLEGALAMAWRNTAPRSLVARFQG